MVVNFNQRELLRSCLQSLLSAFGAMRGSSEIVVIDNASTDGSREMVERDFADVRVIGLAANIGFAGAAQLGVTEALGEWLFYINNDATVDKAALAIMLEEGRRYDDVGAVAALMRFSDRPEIVNSAGLQVDQLGIAFDLGLGAHSADVSLPVAEVFGACAGAALYRRAMLEQVGGFDTSFFMYLEDADLAWRARLAGWRTLLAPEAVVLHHHSKSAGHRSDFKYYLVGRNRVRMLAKSASTAHLLRFAPRILLYDVAYVAYALAVDRTWAPLHGRMRGLRDWRRYRSQGRARGNVELVPAEGLRSALRRNATVSTSRLRR